MSVSISMEMNNAFCKFEHPVTGNLTPGSRFGCNANFEWPTNERGRCPASKQLNESMDMLLGGRRFYAEDPDQWGLFYASHQGAFNFLKPNPAESALCAG